LITTGWVSLQTVAVSAETGVLTSHSSSSEVVDALEAILDGSSAGTDVGPGSNDGNGGQVADATARTAVAGQAAQAVAQYAQRQTDQASRAGSNDPRVVTR
jgi:hypothetical protein